MRSLQSLMNVYEDARLSRQNVYAVYIDYSNAFNTINQDKLLHVLYDLGFPNVAIDAVKGIYYEAVTRIKTCAGKTEAIPVDRGVLQGDTLSPFLFNCFTEPLTRWLHVGGRGYSMGCMSGTSKTLQMKCRTASSGYADDTTLVTNTVRNMVLQMNKVEQYSGWGNLKLNVSKCAATGMPRQDIEKHAMPSPLTQLGCERLKQQLAAIKIDGQPVPFAHPEKAPQKILGVLVTPTLDWKPQIDRLLEEAKIRAGKIVESDATPRQKLTWIQTCLKPYLTYSFPLTYLAKQDIYRLDAVLAQAAKRALRLPLATPTGLVLQQQRLFGAGIESLLIDYAQLSTAHLTRALNDTGKLGTITKNLMKMQHSHLGLHLSLIHI